MFPVRDALWWRRAVLAAAVILPLVLSGNPASAGSGAAGYSTIPPPIVCPDESTAIPLPSDGLHTVNSPATYRVVTHRPYWSVVVVRPDKFSEADVRGVYKGCTFVGSSFEAYGTGYASWVAWDNNSGRHNPGAFLFWQIGNPFQVQFVDGGQILSTDDPAVVQHMGSDTGAWEIDVRDVWMEPAYTYTFTVDHDPSTLDIVDSDPGNARTWGRNRLSALAHLDVPYPENTGTVTVHPTTACWCGVVYNNYGNQGATDIRISRTAT